MMNNAKRGALNIAAGLLGQVVIILLGIVVPRLFLVNFGSETNGFLNSLTQIFSYFTLFEAGVGTASLQALYGPVARGEKDKISGILSAAAEFYRRTGIIYICAVVVLAVVYPLVVQSDIPHMTMVLVILCNGMGGAISYLFQGKFLILLRAEGKNYFLSIVTMGVNIATNLCKIILISLGCNLVVIQASFLLVNILQMAVYEVYRNRKYGWICWKSKPDYDAINQKNSVLIHQFSTLVFNNTDVILLTLLTQNLKIVSVYTIYNMIVSMCRNLIDQVNGGVTFRLGQLYQTDKEKYYEYHEYFEVFNLILSFAVFTAVYLLLRPFVTLYTAGVEDINYLMPGLPLLFVLIQMLSSGRQSSSYLINYAGHFKKTQWRSLLETCINLLVSVIGIWKFGIYGVLLGTVVALLYRANDMIIYTHRHIMGKKPWKTYRRWALNFALFAIVAWTFSHFNLFAGSYLELIGKALLTCIVVGLAFLICNLLFEKNMAWEIWARFVSQGLRRKR